MPIQAEKIADLIHIDERARLTPTLMVRSNTKSTWTQFRLGQFDVNCSQEHIASEATAVVPFELNQITETIATALLRQYSEVKLSMLAERPLAGQLLSSSRTFFHGFIETTESKGTQIGLHCYDPLAFLGKCYCDFGVFEAQTKHIISLSNDPAYALADPHPKELENGISLIPVTEGGEERWVLPSHVKVGGVFVELYQNAYTNNTSDEAYAVTYNGTDFKAGSNRRPIKVAGPLYDDDMDLRTYGQEIYYPDPIPKSYYTIGTDLANYWQFMGYPPATVLTGMVFLGWVDVYVEGTNDIEHILLKILNPIIRGTCSADDAGGTQLTADLSHFIRDGILADGEFAVVWNKRLNKTALLTEVTSASVLTHAAFGGGDGWLEGDEFELRNAVEYAPRYMNTYHYIYDAALTYDNATQSDYFTNTIWPSGVTISRIEWNVKDGSVLKFIETLINEHAAPNYRVWWDHSLCMLRAQYIEQSPFSDTTFYWGQNNPAYHGYAFGKFINTTPAQPEDGTNDFHHVNQVADVSAPKDEKVFATQVWVEGIREHPSNCLKMGNSVIVTQCPGTPPAGWNYTGPDNRSWGVITFLGDHDHSRTYDQVHSEVDGKIIIRDNLTDLVAKTCCSWETSTGHSDDANVYFPIYTIDLGGVIEIGHIKALGQTTLRPEFTWGLRFECCDENGIVWDTGQGHANPDADWQLMHPAYYDYRLKGYEEVHLSDGWIKNTCRFIRVSMTACKTNTGADGLFKKSWYKAGLAELQIYRADAVKGQARIACLEQPVAGVVDTQIPSETSVLATAAIFSLADVGDEIVNLTRGFKTTITAYVNTKKVTVDSIGVWFAGDAFVVVNPIDSKPGIGYWKRYRVTSGTDPEDWGLDGACSLLNMPLLHTQCVSGVPDWWGTPVGKLSVGHRAVFTSDQSLGDTNVCADRAEQVLIETIRDYALVGCIAKWHNELQLYRCVEVLDKRTGLTYRALVENITYKNGAIEFDATVYYPYAWTGELPQAL